MNVELIPLAAVRPHEGVHTEHVQHIMTRIVTDRTVKRPLIVARGCNTLLDGHHRYNALRLLEVDFLPAILVDYDDTTQVEVTAWRENEVITTQKVRDAATLGRLLPAKTSRHLLKFKTPMINVPLAGLFAEAFEWAPSIALKQEGGAPCTTDRT